MASSLSVVLPSKTTLNRDAVQCLKLGMVHKDNTAPVNSIDFDVTGEYLVTSSDDESIRLYSVNEGSQAKTIWSKRYGCSLVRFTHHSKAVICASKNNHDETIRYLSLYDNRYLRYFKGHKLAVRSLEMSPVSDNFMSASVDKTVRFWDIRTPGCQGLMRVPSPASVAYDPAGLVFAVASKDVVRLFDSRSYDFGPFTSFQLFSDGLPRSLSGIRPENIEVTTVKFSPDGKKLLLSTNQSLLLLLDSFKGTQLLSLTGHTNRGSTLEASFSPDGQFVMSGAEDGVVHIWDAEGGHKVTELRGHVNPVRAIKWCPNRMLVASACSHLNLWIPGDTTPSPGGSPTSEHPASALGWGVRKKRIRPPTPSASTGEAAASSSREAPERASAATETKTMDPSSIAGGPPESSEENDEDANDADAPPAGREDEDDDEPGGDAGAAPSASFGQPHRKLSAANAL